jgi:hypothetical protein
MRAPGSTALAGALIALYVLVGWLAMHPAVSEAYEDYYITGDSSLSPTARGSLPAVTDGCAYPHTSGDLAFVGWHVPEQRFRWSDGHRVKIVFRATRDSSAELPRGVCLDVVALGRQRVEWQVNHGPEVRVVVEDRGRLCLKFAADDVEPGENVLRLHLPDAHRPGPEDGRTLGIAVETVTFQ